VRSLNGLRSSTEVDSSSPDESDPKRPRVIQPLILYVVGVVAFLMGCYDYWRDGTVVKVAFLAAGVCVLSAACIQIVRDLWRAMRR
jgi:hypothetical protein